MALIILLGLFLDFFRFSTFFGVLSCSLFNLETGLKKIIIINDVVFLFQLHISILIRQ